MTSRLHAEGGPAASPALETQEATQEETEEEGQGGGRRGEGKTGSEELPSVEKLLELNGEAIFGGKVKVDGDRFEVFFNADGQMQAGFGGKGILDSKSDQMRGANRKFIIEEVKDGVEKLIPGLAAAGLGEGIWVSRFPVAGETWVEMGFRVPNLLTQQSSFRLRVNWERNSGYETSFFQSLSYVSDGTPRTTVKTALKDYQRPASKWFLRSGKTSTKVQYGFRGGNWVVIMDKREMVSVPNTVDKGGHVAIAYSKIAFTLDNLKISGRLDRPWCEKEIARLRQQGKLKTAEE